MRVTILEGTPQEILEVAPDLVSTLKEHISKQALIVATSEKMPGASKSEPEDEDEYGPQAYVDFELAKRVLGRRAVPQSVSTILKELAQAHPEFVTANDLMEALDMSTAQFRGVMGSFGRRLSHTEGYDEDIEPGFFEREWLDELGCYEYRLPEGAYKAVLDKGLI